jgi:hypothetical protein
VYREPSAILQPRTPLVGNPPPPRAGLVYPGPPLCMVGIPRATVPRPIVPGAHASSGRWPFKTQLSNGARGHPVSPMDSARNDLGMCKAQHLDTAYGFIPAGGYYRGDATGHPTVGPGARLRQDMLQSREQYTGYDYLPRDGNNLHDPAVIGDFPLVPAAHLRQGMVEPPEQHTGYGHVTRGVNYRGLPTVTGPPHVAPAAPLRQDMLQHREQYTGYGNHTRDVNNQYTGYGHVTRSVNYRGLPTVTTPRPTVPMDSTMIRVYMRSSSTHTTVLVPLRPLPTFVRICFNPGSSTLATVMLLPASTTAIFPPSPVLARLSRWDSTMIRVCMRSSNTHTTAILLPDSPTPVSLPPPLLLRAAQVLVRDYKDPAAEHYRL